MSQRYLQHRDEEAASSERWADRFGDESDAFDIPQPEKALIERLKRWRQAALVLNASRGFRYTLDLKKEEEKEQTREKIRAHAQAIRAALLFKEAGKVHSPG